MSNNASETEIQEKLEKISPADIGSIIYELLILSINTPENIDEIIANKCNLDITNVFEAMKFQLFYSVAMIKISELQTNLNNPGCEHKFIIEFLNCFHERCVKVLKKNNNSEIDDDFSKQKHL